MQPHIHLNCYPVFVCVLSLTFCKLNCDPGKPLIRKMACAWHQFYRDGGYGLNRSMTYQSSITVLVNLLDMVHSELHAKAVTVPLNITMTKAMTCSTVVAAMLNGPSGFPMRTTKL